MSSQHPDPDVGPLGPWAPARCEDLVIRPKQAEIILEYYNTRNRNIVPTTIAKIAADIVDGRWGDSNGKSNGETIIFCIDGTLIDGQNRLSACVRANKPIRSLVAFGRSKESFYTVDRGRSRTISSDLQIAGEFNTSALAAVLQIVASYQSGVRSSVMVNSTFSASEILEVLEHNPNVRDSVAWATSHKARISAPPRIVAFVHYMAGNSNNPRVLASRDEFFARISDGLHLSERDPIWVLRNKLDTMENNPEARVKKGMGRLAAFTYLHAFIRAWNAHLMSKQISKIQLVYLDKERTQLANIPDIRTTFRKPSSNDDIGLDAIET